MSLGRVSAPYSRGLLYGGLASIISFVFVHISINFSFLVGLRLPTITHSLALILLSMDLGNSASNRQPESLVGYILTVTAGSTLIGLLNVIYTIIQSKSTQLNPIRSSGSCVLSSSLASHLSSLRSVSYLDTPSITQLSSPTPSPVEPASPKTTLHTKQTRTPNPLHPPPIATHVPKTQPHNSSRPQAVLPPQSTVWP